MKHTRSYKTRHVANAKNHAIKLAWLRAHRVSTVVGALLALLSAGTVYVSIMYAVKGSELVRIEKRIREVEAENRQLAGAMLEEMSLTALSEEARGLGMVPPREILYLNSDTGLALLP